MTVFIFALTLALFACWLFTQSGLPWVGVAVAGGMGLLAGVIAARAR